MVGRIVMVRYRYDDLSRSEVWTAYFSANLHTGLTLISVDRDISFWQGQCVAVFGTLFDRATIKDYATDTPPSMIDSDPFDDRGFTIAPARPEKCD